MATDTTTIEDQLRALVRLQLVDTKIDQLTKLRGDLPDEIRDLEDARAGLQTRLGKIDQDKKEAEVQKKKLKLDIAESEGLIPEVRGAAAPGPQQPRVRRAHQRRSRRTASASRSAYEEIERYENLDVDSAETIDGADDQLAELETRIKEKAVELDRVVEETKAEQDEYEAQRDEAAKQIDERFLRAYERLQDARPATAGPWCPSSAAPRPGSWCRPQRQVEVRQRDRIIVSEHDGRIIVDDALFAEVGGEV